MPVVSIGIAVACALAFLLTWVFPIGPTARRKPGRSCAAGRSNRTSCCLPIRRALHRSDLRAGPATPRGRGRQPALPARHPGGPDADRRARPARGGRVGREPPPAVLARAVARTVAGGLAHLDVPALRVDAPDRQSALLLHLRAAARGSLGTLALPRVLPWVRRARRAGPVRPRAALDRNDGRSLGRHRGVHGRVRVSPRPAARPDGVLPLDLDPHLPRNLRHPGVALGGGLVRACSSSTTPSAGAGAEGSRSPRTSAASWPAAPSRSCSRAVASSGGSSRRRSTGRWAGPSTPSSSPGWRRSGGATRSPRDARSRGSSPSGRTSSMPVQDSPGPGWSSATPEPGPSSRESCEGARRRSRGAAGHAGAARAGRRAGAAAPGDRLARRPEPGRGRRYRGGAGVLRPRPEARGARRSQGPPPGAGAGPFPVVRGSERGRGRGRKHPRAGPAGSGAPPRGDAGRAAGHRPPCRGRRPRDRAAPLRRRRGAAAPSACPGRARAARGP